MASPGQIYVPGSGVSSAPQQFANQTSNTPTFSQLVGGGQAGNVAWTSDEGLCVWNGNSWSPISYASPGSVLGVPSTASSNQAATPLNPSQIGSIVRRFKAPGITNVQQVMASPPTVTFSTTNPLSTGAFFSTVNLSSSSPVISTENFSISRGGKPAIVGTSYPNYYYLKFTSTSYTIINPQANLIQIGVVHTGSQIVLFVKGASSNIFAKVNDQYVSLTPTNVPNDGNAYYYSLNFGSSATRRIDFLCDGGIEWGGAYVGKTDTLVPAEIRGDLAIILGDSFTEGNVGQAGTALGYPSVLAEYLGSDNVWPSGIGGTGLTTGGANGSSAIYINRLATDVYPYKPNRVIIAGFYNDGSASYSTFYSAAVAIVQAIQTNLPEAQIEFFGPFMSDGAGYQGGSATGSGIAMQRAALAALIQVYPTVKWLDPGTLPLQSIPQTTTLSANVAANATSLQTANNLIAGATYQYADGSRFKVLSTSSTTSTIDGNANAQTSGATVTQVGPSYISGDGYQGATTGIGNADLLVFTDHIHPTQAGELALGIVMGMLESRYALNDSP